MSDFWVYQEKPFEEKDSENFFGFVYLITNLLTGRMYVGRKYFSSYRRKKVSGKKRRKKVVKKSDWLDYWGSCEELLKDLQKYGKSNFKREILSLHLTKGQVNYAEIREQFIRDVLYSRIGEMRAYYNSNILSRYFAKK